MVAGFEETCRQSRQLAKVLGCPWREIEVHRFPDGESRVRVPPDVRGTVVVHRSLDRPNDKLVELVLAAETLRRQGCDRLILVAPYLCYMRQDIAFHPGEAVAQKIVGSMLARYFDALITVDPHLHRIDRLEQAVPLKQVRSLSSATLISRYLATNEKARLLLGPDQESRQWVEAIAREAGLPCAVASKRRLGDREVGIALPQEIGEFDAVVLVDDVASTGTTLAEAARKLSERGAIRIDVVVTHALFAADAWNRLKQAGIGEIASTDSITHPTNRMCLAPLLADAVRKCAF
ncbi:ribose-phosphate diphosphokinase [Methylococcus geothermalis]|uniref:Ribose-phosphate diphosphokinase n=1 Tax=Methylococcus geothermalis TaxID=2681310 RepID=A0A858QC68_9GAMM|nr:ribose-phosphate diphosphokinase [Methylococcus geothermalis]